MIYAYDGTWGGMMTLVYRTARDGAFPDDIVRFSSTETAGLLLESALVRSEPPVAEAVAELNKSFYARNWKIMWSK